MKTNYILSALLCATAVSFTSCIEENLENFTPAEKGDEIIFGVRAGFENSDPETRTVYSDKDYTVDGVTFERIDWVDGDMIEIYSPEALNSTKSHYKITGLVSGDEGAGNTGKGSDYASLTRYESSGLQWGKGSDEKGTHYFYAMYPSSKLFDENSESNVAQGVKMDGTTISGIVPISQTPSSFSISTTGGTTQCIAYPDMRYAYMVAKATSDPSKNNVSLSFVPIVTAMEVELVMPGDGTNINAVNVAEVKVEGKGIAGSFASNLANWNETYPTCTVGDGSDQITISMWQTASDGTRSPLSMTPGSKLRFTVFLLPGSDIESIKISFSDGSAGFMGKTLSGTAAEPVVPKHKKTIINNLHLPTKGFTLEVGNWMSQLDQETPFNRLSIPGAGAAFSKDGGDGYSSQTLSFNELWNTGIRAFEIITDRQAGTDFGNESLRCNNRAVSGWTVGTVMDNVTAKLSNSKECAVLIFTYQPTGSTSFPREPGTYVTNLSNYFKGYSDQLVKYSPNLTLKDAQGKIIVIVRPSQRDEDTDDEMEAALTAVSTVEMSDKLLVVSGCGTSKDKWATRGYSYSGVAVKEQGSYNFNLVFNAAWEDYCIEQAIVTSSNWANVSKAASEFNYEVNDSTYQIWYQEWARVVPDADKNGIDDVVTSFGNDGWITNPQYWRDSYNEKLDDAKTAFNMALGGSYSLPSATNRYVFINSLSGFYVSSSYSNSYAPLDPNSSSYYTGGSQGDIAGLAADLNEDFYQYVLSKEDQTGATGIVMMDFVANTLNEDGSNKGSYYLPGVIVNNNFKFNPIEVPSAPDPDKQPTEPEEEA